MIINTNNWDWQQYMVSILYILEIIGVASLHGKARTGKYNFWKSFIGVLLGLYILTTAGFFK